MFPAAATQKRTTDRDEPAERRRLEQVDVHNAALLAVVESLIDVIDPHVPDLHVGIVPLSERPHTCRSHGPTASP